MSTAPKYSSLFTESAHNVSLVSPPERILFIPDTQLSYLFFQSSSRFASVNRFGKAPIGFTDSLCCRILVSSLQPSLAFIILNFCDRCVIHYFSALFLSEDMQLKLQISSHMGTALAASQKLSYFDRMFFNFHGDFFFGPQLLQLFLNLQTYLNCLMMSSF